MVDTSDEWITTRTGIRERRIADAKTHTSDMSVHAVRRALEMAETGPEEVEALIVGTVTPDYRLPSTACVVQGKLGLKNAAAFDIVSACTGFINGLSIARSYIEGGQYRKIAVVGAEKLSSMINYEDRNTCVLFGDAAGAAVVEAGGTDRGVISTYLKSDGHMVDWLWIPAGGAAQPIDRDFVFDGSDKIQMNGSDVFKVAVRQMCRAAEWVIKDAGLTPSDVDLVVPHQANIRIIDALARRLGIDREKVVLNIDKYGNTSAASVPTALDETNRAGRLKAGDNILMVAFGGGLIWGSALVRW
jgi:3-oxoacyl-[acyl-carrier-protein] synthase-3